MGWVGIQWVLLSTKGCTRIHCPRSVHNCLTPCSISSCLKLLKYICTLDLTCVNLSFFFPSLLCCILAYSCRFKNYQVSEIYNSKFLPSDIRREAPRGQKFVLFIALPPAPYCALHIKEVVTIIFKLSLDTVRARL